MKYEDINLTVTEFLKKYSENTQETPNWIDYCVSDKTLTNKIRVFYSFLKNISNPCILRAIVTFINPCKQGSRPFYIMNISNKEGEEFEVDINVVLKNNEYSIVEQYGWINEHVLLRTKNLEEAVKCFTLYSSNLYRISTKNCES